MTTIKPWAIAKLNALTDAMPGAHRLVTWVGPYIPVTTKWLGKVIFWGAIAYAVTPLGTIGYYKIKHHFYISSEMTEARLMGPSVVKPLDVITLGYFMARFDTCTLAVARILKRVDGVDGNGHSIYGNSETIIQEGNQNFKPGPKFWQTYTATIPKSMVDGHYELFSRSRYFCDDLDNSEPRIYETQHIPIEIKS
jgi:hypothetical protein